MSQIFFPFPHISHSVVLLFKDSTSGTGQPKGAEFQDQFYTDARIKTQTRYGDRERDLPRPLTFTKFGPAKARPLHHVDAAPNPTLIPLNLAGLRRGLARSIFY